MEEKKFNNAIEKAENLSEDTQKAKGSHGGLSKEERLSLAQAREEKRAQQRLALAEERNNYKQARKEEALRIKAERERQKALELKNNFNDCLEVLALSYNALGDYENAEKYFTKCLKTGSNEQKLRRHLSFREGNSA